MMRGEADSPFWSAEQWMRFYEREAKKMEEYRTRRQIAAQLTDLPEPTMAELEREQAEDREMFYALSDRNDPDAPGMDSSDDDEVRLAVHDAVMEEWA